ncbi:YfeC-like transcriptional regulator [Pantoea sp. 1.19]|uniref:YfeC-like transcriptional regulator n=1 Tax=Pantoea sp. 1.19 TaxID=1925589 RepID=UPI000948AB5C|nr:YfeC-like transcriptional regulator [Pantoea sp. 1.19]
MKKDWLTPDELAKVTGYSRQTINKWVKKEGWETVPKPGVQGGKARLIHIDERVKTFLSTTRHASESTAGYVVGHDGLAALILKSLNQMTPQEQEKLYTMLLREGIQGLLTRLGIDN